ncbi:Hypp4539 [Branchiostoma lanceolatum]|uniref:Hypp4539 protein n=1 Tax=Branchiostoma lanceolatum TaxID=7740 RepID=A0A8K0ABQ7_BRALA|nr:Hypp4539 [Branchiostoma lanceolatum]
MGITKGITASKVIFLVFGVILGYSLSLLPNFGATVNICPSPSPDVPLRSSVDDSFLQLFRETYPDGKDYIIHSFELDVRLAPYFASYSNHVLHCPVAVAGEDGNITAYAESSWKPDKGKVSGQDIQWGGGAIYASESEKLGEIHGRRFGVQNVIPTVDLSKWIQENTGVLQKDTLVPFLFIVALDYALRCAIDGRKKELGFTFKKRASRRVPARTVTDFDFADDLALISDAPERACILLAEIPDDTPGAAGVVYSNCSRSPDGPARLALTVQVGMNRKAAYKLVETIRAHSSNMPVTLFVYGDFVQDFLDLINKWADRYTIGIRERLQLDVQKIECALSSRLWVLQNANVMRMCLISAVQRMKEVGVRPVYYYPDGLSTRVKDIAKNRGLRIIKPTTKFPPNLGTLLTEDNYYRYRDVERTP